MSPLVGNHRHRNASGLTLYCWGGSAGADWKAIRHVRHLRNASRHRRPRSVQWRVRNPSRSYRHHDDEYARECEPDDATCKCVSAVHIAPGGVLDGIKISTENSQFVGGNVDNPKWERAVFCLVNGHTAVEKRCERRARKRMVRTIYRPFTWCSEGVGAA